MYLVMYFTGGFDDTDETTAGSEDRAVEWYDENPTDDSFFDYEF